MSARTDTTSTPAPAQRHPVWPVTFAVVVAGLALLAWDLFAAGINTAPFFGDTASRDRYAESGATLVTALVPVALLCLLGLLAGSRFGLLLLAVPAAVLAVGGLDMLGNPGDPNDADPGRAVRPSDFVADLTRLNWIAAAALLLLLLVLLLRRRRSAG